MSSRPSIAMIACVVVAVVTVTTAGCGRPKRAAGSAPAAQPAMVASGALVYPRPLDGRVEILVQAPGPGRAQAIYSTASRERGYRMPDEFGFLPSPSGRLLVVWEESSRTDPYGLPKETQWTLVTVADGNAVRVATTQGRVALLPHWISDTKLAFMGEGGAETRIAVGAVGPVALPPPIPRDGDQKARDEYRRRYCQTEHDELLSALQKSRDELGLQGFHEMRDGGEWQATVSDMVLWPLGIPRLDRQYYLGIRRPEVAFSPDGTLLALADAWTDAPAIKVWHGDEEITVHASGARLAVYRAASGECVWKQTAPPKPRRLPENRGRMNPSPLPWISPWYTDPRWSRDGRYLSFTKYEYSGVPEVSVVEVGTWQQVVHVPRASDAFIVPVGAHTRGR